MNANKFFVFVILTFCMTTINDAVVKNLPKVKHRQFQDQTLTRDEVWKKFGWNNKVFYNKFTKLKWNNERIIYDVDPHLTPGMLDAVYGAVGYMNSLHTCVRWYQRDPLADHPEDDWITFQHYIQDKASEPECSSSLGRKGGHQYIRLGTNCERRNNIAKLQFRTTVLHEMMHALGFEHEHQRPDRDCHLFIDNRWLFRDSFQKVKGHHFSSGFPYDFESVLHYKTSDRHLMHAHKNFYQALGRLDGQISDNDLVKINHIYCGSRATCQVWHNCESMYDGAIQNPYCWRQGGPYVTHNLSYYKEPDFDY